MEQLRTIKRISPQEGEPLKVGDLAKWEVIYPDGTHGIFETRIHESDLIK